MNPKDQNQWKSHVLDEIFVALAASEKLAGVLVFKGARVLNIQLGGNGRQSLDLDSNLNESFTESHPIRESQRTFLEIEMRQAIRNRFETLSPVQYELKSLRVEQRPRDGNHSRGWDAFDVKITFSDLSKKVNNLPALEIDIAAPEKLLPTSFENISVGKHFVSAYTLERIAGEKLRAFLSSLPEYARKIQKQNREVRAKDLYDISRIFGIRPIAQVEFWNRAGQEFRIACQSRFIDCCGLETFQQDWEVTRESYQQATIPDDISFEEAESTLTTIIQLFETEGIIPFTFELPEIGT